MRVWVAKVHLIDDIPPSSSSCRPAWPQGKQAKRISPNKTPSFISSNEAGRETCRKQDDVPLWDPAPLFSERGFGGEEEVGGQEIDVFSGLVDRSR